MARDHAATVHDDFRMVERGGTAGDATLMTVRAALRSAWSLPTDTFVTSDLPVLLTRLCHCSDAGDQPALTHDQEPTGRTP